MRSFLLNKEKIIPNSSLPTLTVGCLIIRDKLTCDMLKDLKANRIRKPKNQIKKIKKSHEPFLSKTDIRKFNLKQKKLKEIS